MFFLTSNSFSNIQVSLHFSGDNAYSYVEDQLNINATHFRIPGYQGREDCAEYFIEKFREINLNFSYDLHNFTIQSVECQNVLFKLNEHNNNIVILGAHYDSRARATKDPDELKRDEPVPGANDGASGCAVLIDLARVFYSLKENLTCQLWFLFFDAEDQGYDYGPGISGWDWCEGSDKFVEDIENFYNSSLESFDAMILLDMVGGVNLKFINEQYSTSSLLEELFEVGRLLGYISQFPNNPEVRSIRDDHVAFVNYGIPSADLIINFWNNPGWPYHHTVNDDIIAISASSLEVTGKTVEQFIYNHYFNNNNSDFGNYPWTNYNNLLDTDIVILIMILGVIFGGIIIFFFIRRTRANKRELIRN
ncbi:MAG: M28 family peptidase [Promethearchaeota archaeon]|nr:MAG: M28 family peptidase [Candidatus Lokiarchaeota archaeon]